jgi:hypothetical protein
VTAAGTGEGRVVGVGVAAAADGPAWDGEPVPLTARRLLPALPTDALPGWLADQVAAVAEFTQTPPDRPGCVALAALSTAAGGRAAEQGRPAAELDELATAAAAAGLNEREVRRTIASAQRRIRSPR